MTFDEAVRRVLEYRKGHANYVFEDGEGHVVYKCDSNCYWDVFTAEGVRRVCLILPEDVDTNYLDFIVNRSTFSKAFLTKNVSKGIDEGFDLDVSQDVTFLKAASIAFRCQAEHGWDWDAAMSLGVDEADALFLVSHYEFDSGVWQNIYTDWWHHFYDEMVPIRYYGDYPKTEIPTPLTEHDGELVYTVPDTIKKGIGVLPDELTSAGAIAWLKKQKGG